MKRWLFLDDMPERHAGIDKIVDACDLSDVEVSHVWTVDEAIDALQGQWPPFDCVFLDHDLDQTDPQETGFVVAEHIALHMLPECIPHAVVIHSHNPEGADRMAAILKENGVKTTVVKFGVNGV